MHLHTVQCKSVLLHINSPSLTRAECQGLTRFTGAVAIDSLDCYRVVGATGEASKSTVEFRGQAGVIALTARGSDIVQLCPLAGRPGHISSVADTVGSHCDVGRNTWHCKERMDERVIRYTS